MRVFGPNDAVPAALDDERIAVLGCGNVGRPFALNLRDSGVRELVVGNTVDEYAQYARTEGFEVVPIHEACARSDIALVLLPDEVTAEVFDSEIAPSLAPGSAVVFASGCTLAYRLIEPPPGVDVLLLAPRLASEAARERYLAGQGFIAYVSVEADASGRAWRRLWGWLRQWVSFARAPLS
jgi:ketol-acid reductoisomerase